MPEPENSGSVRYERVRGTACTAVTKGLLEHSHTVDPEAEAVEVATVLAEFVPGSYPPPWSWDDEERDIREAVCRCCGVAGHYQAALEAYAMEHGIPVDLDDPIILGDDGRVWGGHHRLIAARALGITHVEARRWREGPGESVFDAPAFKCPICGGAFVDRTGIRTQHHMEVHAAMGQMPDG